MYTDMVGYTALGQRNEALSLALVEEQRKLIRPILDRHSGREVKTMGDAFLVEFPSALEAIRCAYEVQRAIKEFNISLSEERRIHLRVGIHLGDVVESGGDISGDAVNVASRVEPLAEAGGICLTRQVYDQVHNKFELPMTSIGVKPMKNVATQLEVFKLILPWEEDVRPMGQADTKRVAVLPFANMSPDPSDSYFADGITEEVISTLSGVNGLSVISRTSVMSYKGTNKKASEIGRELDVGTILEGSFRKAGNRIRVTAQLIDLRGDTHLWATNYDRELDDVFAIQSEIAVRIAESLKVRLIDKELRVLEKAPTVSTEAYAYYLKGIQMLTEGSDSSLRQALELFNTATKVDPSFARAYVAVGRCYAQFGVRSYLSFDESISGMKSAARRALELDPNLAEGHYLLSWVAWGEDDHGTDELEARRAIELNPNLSQAHSMLGMVKATDGYPNEGIRLLEVAHSLDPLNSETIRQLGRLYNYRGMKEKTLELCDKNLKIAPLTVSLILVNYYYLKGDYPSAERELEPLESLYPKDFEVICNRGYLSALEGNKAAVERVIAKLERDFPGGATLSRNIGYMMYYLGDSDAFFSAMDKAVEEHVLEPFSLRYSPLLEKARQDPRYSEIMRKNGLDLELKE
jgi:adenylate cyclase